MEEGVVSYSVGIRRESWLLTIPSVISTRIFPAKRFEE